MKKQTFITIISILSITLLGIVLLQFYWIRNVYQLEENNFNNKINVALKSVVNQIFVKNNLCRLEVGPTSDTLHQNLEISPTFNKVVLNSLVSVEFTAVGISSEKYVYGIINKSDSTLLEISSMSAKDQLMKSPHFVGLSLLCDDCTFVLAAYFPNENTYVWRKILPGIILSGVLITVLVLCVGYTVWRFLQHKKLADMKNDFINNMTHEFKTPIATISLASEMLQNSSILASEEKTRKYVRIIYDENARLKSQVEQVLQTSAFEKGKLKFKLSEFDLHDMIRNIAENFQLTMKERCGQLSVNLKASRSILFADKLHIENVINNLLENANKYSPESPNITLTTTSNDAGITISISDCGIGISGENQKLIFNKLYRVPTGKVHDVKGFGLGLFYVKTIVEAHGGKVKVSSELGKGSCFEVFLLYKSKINTKYLEV